MNKQLSAFTTRRTASSETKALQKAMGESEAITNQFYERTVERKRERIAAKRDAHTVSLFNEQEGEQKNLATQYLLF